MEFVLRNRWSGWIVLFLLALNVFSVGMLMYMGLRKPGPPPPRQEGEISSIDFLIHELEMSEDQMKRLSVIQVRHHDERQRADRRLQDIRSALFFEAFAESPDSLRLNDLTEKARKSHELLDLMAVGHMNEIRTILTPEQDRHFVRLLKEMISRPLRGNDMQARSPDRTGDRPPPRPGNGRRRELPPPQNRR